MGRIATTLTVLLSVCACSPADDELPVAPHLIGAHEAGSRMAAGSPARLEQLDDPAAIPAAPGGAAVRHTDQPHRLRLRVRMSAVGRHVFGDGLEAAFEDENLGIDLELDHSSDRGGIEHVILERADCALVATEPSTSEMAQGARGLLLGHHVLAVVIHPRNPMRSILRETLRDVLTGNTREWRLITYQRGEVALKLPPEGPVADHMAALLIKGDRFDRSARRAADSATILERVAEDTAALGVVPLVALQNGPEGPRPLWIEGVEPSARAFAAGRYPHGASIHLVHGPNPGEGVQALIGFFASEAGGDLLDRSLSAP